MWCWLRCSSSAVWLRSATWNPSPAKWKARTPRKCLPAPATCANFVNLVNKGFYNGLTFHRIVPGFVIQGGDPLGNGTGGPGWHIPGEFAANGFKNDLQHVRGVLSWARAQDPNSAGSQFFIMVDDAPYLDGQYAAFGRLTAGLDVVDQIVAGLHGFKPVMKTVTIEK